MYLPRNRLYSPDYGWITGCYIVSVSQNKEADDSLRHFILCTEHTTLESFIKAYYKRYQPQDDVFNVFATVEEAEEFMRSFKKEK